MIEEKKQAAFQTESLQPRRIFILVEPHLLVLTGHWQWNLQAEELLCSNVILAGPPAAAGLPATRCLIHPDDLPALRTALEGMHQRVELNLAFRVITTYGEVKTITGKGTFTVEEEAGFTTNLHQEAAARYSAQRLQQQEAEQRLLELKLYHQADQLNGTGIWYLNTQTHEAFYSDQVYRIHGLPPQSLNAHLHTFHPFIHPDDHEQVVEAIDKAYKAVVPLHLEYRIVTPRGDERIIQQEFRWEYSPKGQVLLTGFVQDISPGRQEEEQRRQLENDVRLKSSLLQAAEEASLTGTWWLNLYTRKTYYSDQVYRLHGVKPGTIPVGINSFMRFVHPDDQQRVSALVQKGFQQHQTEDIQYRIIRPDGKTRTLRQQGRVIIGSGNEMLLLGTLRDVTEVTGLEADLQRAEQKLHLQRTLGAAAEEMAGLGHWTLNCLTGEMACSNNFYGLLGIKPQSFDLTQQQLLHYIHPDDQAAYTEAVRQVRDGSSPDRQLRFRVLRGGEQRLVKGTFRMAPGLPGLLTGMVQDITAENALRRQLEERIRFAEHLSDSLTDRVFVTDIGYTVVAWNRACETVYGLKKEQAIGTNLFDLLPYLKEPEPMSAYRKALEGEPVQLRQVKDGFKGQHQLTVVPLSDSGEEVTYILTILHDITEQYEMRRQLTSRLNFIESLVESSVDRVIVLDRHMNYQYWNRRAEDYYDLRKEEVLGKNILEVFPGFINDPSYHEFKQALKGETVHIKPDEGLFKDHYQETFLIPLKNEQREVNGVLWVVHDLSKDLMLRQYKQKDDIVLDALNENYFELDADYRFTYLNQNALAFFGVQKEEVVGRPLLEVFPGYRDTPIHGALVRTMEEKTPLRDEFVSPTRGISVYVSIAPLPAGLAVGFFDIQELKETKLMIQQIAEATPDLIFVFNLQQYTAVYANKGIHQVLGYPQPAAAAEALEALVHPEDLARKGAWLEQLLQLKDGEHAAMELRLRHAGGGWRWYGLRQSVFKRDAAGRPVELLGILTDITERVQSVEKLKTEHLRLQESKRLTEQIMDASPDFIMVFDLELNKVVFVNRDAYKNDHARFTETLELDYEGTLARAHPDDRPALHHFIQGFRSATDQEIRTLEYRVVRDSRIYWYCARGKVFRRDADGRPTQYISVVQDITAHKEVAREVGESRQFIQQVAGTMPDVLFVLDILDRKVVYINHELTAVLGYTEEQVYALGPDLPTALLHPEDYGRCLQYLQKLAYLQDSEVDEIDFRIRTKDRGWQWFKAKAIVFKRREDGVVWQVIGIGQNITDKKENEEALLHLNGQLSMQNKLHDYAEEIAGMGTWTWNPKTGKAVFSNNMFLLLGMQPQEVEPDFDTIPRLLHPEDREKMLQQAEQMKTTHRSGALEFRALRPDGTERHFRSRSKFIVTDTGTQLYIGTMQDVTGEVMLRQQLEQRTLFVETLIDSSMDRILVFDTGGRIIAWNQRCVEAYRTSREEALQHTFYGLFPALRKEKAVAGAVDRAMGGELVYLPPRKDLYQDLYSEVYFIPLKNETGAVYAVLNVLHDVTRVQQAKQELKEMNRSLALKNRELEEKNEEINSFAFIASHDLKEPLRKIHTFSDWLLHHDNGQLSPQATLYLQRISASVRRMDLLIEDIMVLTKIHADTKQNAVVDLNTVLAHVQADLKETIEATGAEVRVGQLPKLKANENQLFYLFRNLLTNALKFQPPGNKPLIGVQAACVSAEALPVSAAAGDKNYVRIAVSDNGIGFDPRQHKKIFQVFQRLHKASQYEGTGIGLTICKKIMDNHGGFIRGESNPGTGAEFSCYFPMQPSAAENC